MPKWFEVSILTFTFYCLLFVCWMLIILPLEGDTDVNKLGSSAYIPHAGRVIPVLFFGAPAIPAMIFAEWICWNFVWDTSLWERSDIGTLISSSAVILAWLLFKGLGLDLRSMEVLKNTNWKHVTLFVIVTAMLNGIGNGAWYTFQYESYDPLITIRFAVGDIVGAISVLIIMMFMAAVMRKI